MPNVTLSIDGKLLAASREYASRHNTTLNTMIREMLKQRVLRGGVAWIDECFAQMDRVQANSNGARWTRDELYDL